MSVARFIADQRTLYRVPVAFYCALLGVSVSWFYKWTNRQPTTSQRRQAKVDAAVATEFVQRRGLHGSPRLFVDLREKGWRVSERTVADSMRRQGLVARKTKRRKGLIRQDKTRAAFPDLLRRDFTAAEVNTRWVGDITEIPTAAGKSHLATVIDLYSRRLLEAATSRHPDAGLACAAIEMAITVRGGLDAIRGVVFHTDHGSTYTADAFTKLCRVSGIRQSMGQVRSCVDNAAAEAFFSTLE